MALRFASIAPVLVLVACASQPSAEVGQSEVVAQPAANGGYAFELKARSSEDPDDPSGTFLVPAGASAKNATPCINESGAVAIDLLTADNLEHVFADGKVRYTGPDPDATISDTAIDDAGNVVFNQWNGTSGNGVWTYSSKTGEPTFLSADPLGAEAWGNVSNRPSSGQIGVRPSGGGKRWLGYLDADGFTKLAVEDNTNPSSPYSYLFGPKFDRAGRAALKVMLAAGGNDIRILAKGAQPIIVASERAASPAGAYDALDNGVGFNDVGQVAFVAKTGTTRAVYLANGTQTTKIAAEGEADVKEITYFTPVVNDAGKVAFRGMDTQDRNVIWLGDGTTLVRVATAGDTLPSDKGDALAIPETAFDPANKVVFGGGIAMNGRGQIAFLAALASKDAPATRYGTALFVATPR